MTLNQACLDQLTSAYKLMATEAKYRPAAPSDGFGHITTPIERLDLDEEAIRYAKHWWDEENAGKFRVGCADFPNRRAMVFCIEAARLLCGDDEAARYAKRLIRLAARELR